MAEKWKRVVFCQLIVVSWMLERSPCRNAPENLSARSAPVQQWRRLPIEGQLGLAVASAGTNRDLSCRMTLRNSHWWIPIAVTWASAACAQSPDRRATSDPPHTADLTTGARAKLPADPLATRGDSLVRAGRAWRATVLLAPSVRTPASAAPAVRLVAARAAAAWQGWAEVDRLLRGATWLDSTLDGEGRELLARSALERNQPAEEDARAAVAAARTPSEQAVRRVLLARALDRADSRDSAAALYAAGAAQLPAAADWLRLRAAGVSVDSASRAALFAKVVVGPARGRIAWTDAQARERARDFEGAARVYRSVKAEPAALRAEALAARDDAARAAVAGRVAAYLSRNPPVADARVALDVLESLRMTLPRDQELAVARAATEAGVAPRAIAGFTRAQAAAPLAARDQLTYASALARGGRSADAIRLYSQVAAADASLAPTAEYQRARVLLQSGNGAGARAALRTIVERYATEGAAAAPALLLLADLQVDDADLSGAAQSLDQLARRFPGADQAPLARFRAGLLAWNGDASRAAALFDSLAARYPNDVEAPAARYWAARAHERAGRRAEAQSRWRSLATEAPLTYYGVQSARRLGAFDWKPPAGPDTAAHIASVDSVVERVRALHLLGMDVESKFEIDALAARGEQQPAEAGAIAQALSSVGESARALRLALRTIDRGGESPRVLYRYAFPVLHADALQEYARAAGVDPALVAGVIRQESTWNPDAVSPAGARGLMQLLPSVGASIASSRGYPVWNPVLLFEPDVSLQLGTLHLASSLRGGEQTARALAAYNAGASRVTRWSNRPGTTDPEVFTEWIPFVETRDYVRVVSRNAAVYSRLYGW
jgi:soluble lytic murein transglycosylase